MFKNHDNFNPLFSVFHAKEVTFRERDFQLSQKTQDGRESKKRGPTYVTPGISKNKRNKLLK